jgi:hypothetical protein
MMRRNAAMTTIRKTTLLLAAALAGCATRGGGPEPVGAPAAPSIEARALRMAERDPIEAFRLLRQGAEARDAECALRFLAFAERKESTQSQREYARLFLEKLLAGGPLGSRKAGDRTAEAHHRLALSWHFLEPRNSAKVREHVEAMARVGMTDAMADSAIVREMIRSSGAAVDLAAARDRGRRRAAQDLVRACDATPADETGRMTQHAPAAARSDGAGPGTQSLEIEVTAWGGGNDKLLQAAGVLAFVVNGAGEPVFRGRRLWIRNGSPRAVAYAVPAAGAPLRELRPGSEETVELDRTEPETSGIDVVVRYAWKR